MTTYHWESTTNYDSKHVQTIDPNEFCIWGTYQLHKNIPGSPEIAHKCHEYI